MAVHQIPSDSRLDIWIRKSEEELAGAVHEVPDDPHHVTGLEVLGGVSADDQVVGGLDLISHNVVNLNPPVSVSEPESKNVTVLPSE